MSGEGEKLTRQVLSGEWWGREGGLMQVSYEPWLV